MIGTAVWLISLGLAFVLGVVAVEKARAVATFELALVRLLPPATWRMLRANSRTCAKVIIGVEALTAAALLAVPLGVVAAWVLILFFGFLCVHVVSWRRRLPPCGCFGEARVDSRITDGLRATGLFVASACLFAGSIGTNMEPIGRQMPAVAVALVAAVLLFSHRSAISHGVRRNHSQDSIQATSGSEELSLGTTSERAGATTRRTLIARTTAGALSLLAVRLAGGVETAVAHHDCLTRLSICYECCGASFPACSDCCFDCYTRCLVGGGCPENSCFGCWSLMPMPCTTC